MTAMTERSPITHVSLKDAQRALATTHSTLWRWCNDGTVDRVYADGYKPVVTVESIHRLQREKGLEETAFGAGWVNPSWTAARAKRAGNG